MTRKRDAEKSRNAEEGRWCRHSVDASDWALGEALWLADERMSRLARPELFTITLCIIGEGEARGAEDIRM